MRIVILGAGQVGHSLAQYLVKDGNHVILVDHDEQLLARISEKLDIQPVCGFASYPSTLEQAGIREADLLIAVTASDEVNMVACEIAHALYKVKFKVARIRNQNYLRSDWSDAHHPQRLAIDVIISPEIEVASAIVRNNQVQGAFEVLPIADDHVKIIGVRCDNNTLFNTQIRLVYSLLPHIEFEVFAVRRDSRLQWVSAKDVILPDDDVYFLCQSHDVPEVAGLFGYIQARQNNLIIVGGGNIGRYLAHEIRTADPSVNIKLIERDVQVCRTVAKTLSDIQVIHGDGLDYEVLAEADLEHCETLIAVTNEDKVNILAGLVAKRHGVKRALSLLNNSVYAPLLTSLGVDAVISPKALTIASILRHVRKKHLDAVHVLGDDEAMIVEAYAKENSQIIGLRFEELALERNIIVLGMLRHKKLVCNMQNLVINAGDYLLLACYKNHLGHIEELFTVHNRYYGF